MASGASPRVILNGRYRLDDVLGSGGMAVVHRAHDLRLDRTVAVKLLHPPYARDQAFLLRFLREAQIAARISDAPNIATVFDVGRDADAPYIVMEYVDGPSLQQYLAQRGPLPVPEALTITRQVAEALAAAHSHGVVHRDIKPHNILVQPSGVAKVADFGIAAALSETRLTAPGTIIGSAHYMAPEQVRGEPASAVSDVYSLGVLLFEMLVGSLPFNGSSPAAVAAQQVMAPVPPLQALRPAIPAPVAHLVEQMLAKDPARRISSAREVIDELDRLLSLPAGAVLPDSATETVAAPIAPAPERHRLPPRVAAAGALLAVLAGLLVAVSLGLDGQHRPRHATPTPHRAVAVRTRAPAITATPRPVYQPTVAPTRAPLPTPAQAPQPAQVPPSQVPPPPVAPAPGPGHHKGVGHAGDNGQGPGDGNGHGDGKGKGDHG